MLSTRPRRGRSGRRSGARPRSGLLLRLLRHAHGLTLRQLGPAVSVPPFAIETLTRWESGKRTPSADARDLLATFFRCGALLRWDPTPVLDETAEAARLAPTIIAALCTFTAKKATP